MHFRSAPKPALVLVAALASLFAGSAPAWAQEATSSSNVAVTTLDAAPTHTTLNDGMWTPEPTRPTDLLPPFIPPAVRPPGIHQGHVEDDGEFHDILCNSFKCSNHRDWLTKLPNAAANWTLGTISLLVGLLLVKANCTKRSYRCFMPTTSVAMFMLFISLALRASLGLSTGNKRSIYVASIFFNYLAAFLLGLLMIGAARPAITRFQPRTSGETWVGVVITHLIFWASVVLVIVGLVFSFKLKSGYSDAAGAHCIQAALVLLLASTAISALIALVRIKCVVQTLTKNAVWAGVLWAPLILLWGSFMLARTFVHVNSVARTSEILFGLLNYAPLIACSIVGLALGQPLELPGRRPGQRPTSMAGQRPVSAAGEQTSQVPGQSELP